MQVEVKLDPERKEIGIVVLAPAPSPEVEELVRRLEAEQLSPLRGWQGDTMTLLPQSQVVRCYAQDKRVYAAVDGGAEEVAAVLLQNGTERPVTLRLPGMTREERDIVLAGCLINYYAK